MSLLSELDIAWVDVETTGLQPDQHELLEVAVVRTTPRLEIVGQATVRIKPSRIDRADAKALAVCGYSAEEWADALPLRDALCEVAPHLEGAAVAGHNLWFDWSFITRGFRLADLAMPATDYHRIDTATLAWQLAATGEALGVGLDAACAALGIPPRPEPHRALDDALACLEVARRMRRRAFTAGRFIACLRAMEGAFG
jgi:DNA polymerase III subunit epsilon